LQVLIVAEERKQADSSEACHMAKVCLLAGFRNVWQNTPCPVCHPPMACFSHCCWTVLPDGVIQHNFYTNGVILHACVHGRRKDFFQGGTIGFFQKFLYGGQSGEICFYHPKLDNSLFCWNFQIPAPLPTPMQRYYTWIIRAATSMIALLQDLWILHTYWL